MIGKPKTTFCLRSQYSREVGKFLFNLKFSQLYAFCNDDTIHDHSCEQFSLRGEVFAHRPYEHAAGGFKRSDGVTVSTVEHYVDGMFGDDPVVVQFRLPDGTKIADKIARVTALLFGARQFALRFIASRRIGFHRQECTAVRWLLAFGHHNHAYRLVWFCGSHSR